MQHYPGHNRRTAIHAERNALRDSLATADTQLAFAFAGHKRAKVELERSCWQDSAFAPTDRAHAAREALRAAHARRARLRDEVAEIDYELIDNGDIDDIAA